MPKIKRESIIAILCGELILDKSVHAMWLEGADAMDTVDQYSDMDVWVDVKDGQESKVLTKVEKALATLGKVDTAIEINHPHPKIRQKFFHVVGTPKFLIIDVCIQKHSRQFWFTAGMKGETFKVVFDRSKVIDVRKMDKRQLLKENKFKKEELKKTFPFFQAWVEKEIARGNFLEASHYYQKFILEPFVEMLRIKFQPTKREYGFKHIKRDLPECAVTQLEGLSKIDSLFQLKKNINKANQLWKIISR